MSRLQTLSDDDFAKRLSECIAKREREQLRDFWLQLDERARSVLAVEIGFYVGRNAEKEIKVINDRLARNRLVSREIKKEIKSLKKAHKATVLFESLIFGNPDPILGGRRLFEPIRRTPFSSLLASEETRLSTQLRQFERQSTTKRFGVSRRNYWLLFAQEFTRVWSREQIGKALKLTSGHLATLIDCAREANWGINSSWMKSRRWLRIFCNVLLHQQVLFIKVQRLAKSDHFRVLFDCPNSCQPQQVKTEVKTCQSRRNNKCRAALRSCTNLFNRSKQTQIIHVSTPISRSVRLRKALKRLGLMSQS